MSKQIEQITDEDLLAIWPRIGGAPHMFEFGKEDLKQLLITGSCEENNLGIMIDYYTMAAIVDTLRAKGYETIIYTDAGLSPVNNKAMTERQKGNFTIKNDWSAPTDSSMYECVDCLSNGTLHKIIDLPGPPASGNEVSRKGDPITIRVCTGCDKYDGPWVKAPW